MSKDSIVERLQRLARLAGGAVRPTGESLRRSWAIHAYEAGLDLLSINRHLRRRRYDTDGRFFCPTCSDTSPTLTSPYSCA